ncbi:MAG TPA: YIP1 family protein [Bacteroidetes bacterium]|nr:YIP1 family protein [Bacteroidota bacterium]
MSNGSFTFNNLIKESKDSLFNPKAYFASMKTEGGLGEPILKALVYGVIAGIFSLLWGLLKVGTVTGSLFGGAVGVMAFIWAIIGAIIGLFIGAIIVLVLSAICGGKTDFEPSMRVTASLMVLMPISAFFGFASGISSGLGSVITLIINLYGIWMLYHALVQSLKAKESTTRVISIVLVVIAAIMLIIGLTARRAADRYMDRWGTDIESLEKDIKQSLEEMEDSGND